jgi:hypothetical protein
MKKTYKILLIASIFLSLFIFTSNVKPSFAAADPCEVELEAFNKGLNIFNLDIRRTVDNFLVSWVISVFANVLGVNPDLVKRCEGYVLQKFAEGSYGPLSEKLSTIYNNGTAQGSICTANYDEMDPRELMYCDALLQETSDETVYGNTREFADRRNNVKLMAVESSLVGFGNLLEGFTMKEPLPVNLAYAWDRSVSKIPVVGTALASSDEGTIYENLPVLAAVYGIWEISRNVSIAAMSVVILYTGIMIILRKKVNQQLVVSVQYAIPKIIIGIVLIFSSYLIGGTIVSIGWGLFRGAAPLILRIIARTPDADTVPSGLLSVVLINMTLGIARGGNGYLVLALIIGLVMSLARIVLLLKAFMLYIKMAASIISAPIEFVIGAIPGSESKITDWFARMGKWALTLFGMGVVVPLTLLVATEVMLAYMNNNMEVGGWGVIFAILAPLIVTIFGFSFGIGMENKVDALFGGGKKR